MKISCVVTICDKDYQYIYSVVQSIRDSMKCDYEILVMDNREKNKNINLTNCNVTIIDMGGNKWEFEARKQSIKYATGDYIWFIDGDDLVIDSVIPETDSDIVCFNYILSNNAPQSHFYKTNSQITSDIFTLETFEKIGNPVWSKLIKKDFLKEVYSELKDVHRINMMEDATLLILMLHKARSIEFNNRICYRYNMNTTMCERDSYDDIEKLENMFMGCNIPIEILDNAITQEEQNISCLKTSDLWRNNLILMKTVYDKCSENIKPFFIDRVVKNYYTEEEIAEVGGF